MSIPHKYIRLANECIDKGERLYEIVEAVPKQMEQLRMNIEGESDEIESLLSLMTLERKVPLKDPKKLRMAHEIMANLKLLKKRADEAYKEHPCDHDWVLEGFPSGGFSPDGGLDVHCSICESSMTIPSQGKEADKVYKKYLGIGPDEFRYHDRNFMQKQFWLEKQGKENQLEAPIGKPTKSLSQIACSRCK